MAIQANANQDGELGAGVKAVDVLGRIGLRESQLLRFAQSGCERDAINLNLAEDVIARAIEDAADPEQFIARETFVES